MLTVSVALDCSLFDCVNMYMYLLTLIPLVIAWW